MSGSLDNAVGQRCRRIAGVAVVALGVLVCRASGTAGAEQRPGGDVRGAKAAEGPRMGKSIRVMQPISAETVGRVRQFARGAVEKAQAAGARPVLILEFQVPDEGGDSAGDSEFGVAYGLADFLSGEELNVAWTVAYVPESIRGHAVLVALACDEIMMAADAQLGPVGAQPEKVVPTERTAYTEIAKRRGTVDPEVALWLLDPSLEVLKVETLLSRKYVIPKVQDDLVTAFLVKLGINVAPEGPEGVEELRNDPNVRSVEPLRDLVEGEPGQFSGEEARRLGFVKYLVSDRAEVAKVHDLPPSAMDEDRTLTGGWKAAGVKLEGPIDAEVVNRVQRLIEDEIRRREMDFLCVWIDSLGGSPADSIRLAGFLAGLESDNVHTVAYIPGEARSDAALIALACNEVVMKPSAELGGSGGYKFTQDEINYTTQAIRDVNGPWKARPWSLAAAVVDPKLEVFEYTRPGELRYFCEEQSREVERDQPGANWQKGRRVTRPDTPFSADGVQATEKYQLANRTVGGFTEFMRYYALEGELAWLETGWADFLIRALARPEVSAVLLMIAFVAMYAELHAPGIGVGGFVATVCFVLFFWSHCLEGTAGWLEVMLFLAGVACLLLEIFVLPGFGIFGLGGGCLVLGSLILASQTFVLPQTKEEFVDFQYSLLTVAAAGVGIVAAAVLLRRWLPRAPIFNQVLLQPPVGEEAEIIKQRELLVDLKDFVGSRGTTTTQLTPSGKARFGDTLVDVITDGDVVARGTEIEVVEIHGNRVIVKAVQS